MYLQHCLRLIFKDFILFYFLLSGTMKMHGDCFEIGHVTGGGGGDSDTFPLTKKKERKEGRKKERKKE